MMKQHPFEQRYTTTWASLTALLDRLEHRAKPQKNSAASEPLPLAEVPAAYRRLCQQLAIARSRHYSASLLARLNHLALRTYQQLYRAPRQRWQAVLQFLAVDFPQRVRADAPLFWLCSLLFYGPLLSMAVAVYQAPELIYSLLPPQSVEEIESMYALNNTAMNRASSSDLEMFGYYIYNNIGIGFRIFASGVLLGIGSIVMLIFNGVFIGAVAGYLTQRGLSETFYTFVAGHGSFELTGIVLASVAGLKLGWAVVAPGRLRRSESLRHAARSGIRLIIGVAALLVLAAFIEAFWSSNRAIPAEIKYTVGILGWLLIALYLSLAGRRHAS